MTQRTDTYDDEQWQLVPKKLTTTMGLIFGMNDSVARTERRYERFLAVAPTPPVAEPVEGLADLLQDVERVMAKNIYPKPDVGPEHPWNVLKRLREYRAALAQRGEKT